MTIRPSPDASSAGSRALVTRSVPRTLVSHIQRQSSRSAVATGSSPFAPPALLTSRSTRSRPSTNRATDSSSVMSSCLPVPPISAASSVMRSTRRAPTTTW
ncbi:Uncharacterised protein [Mycobacteroides abscessus subsp. abscessus]|nr:Uncharacterised protein [Mycobacteroides abscessus subsp. abscessus]